jgi:predicted phosphate transport protein (TIGR00153 family)
MADTLKPLLNLFSKSPFTPLNVHAQKVVDTVEKMDEAIRGYIDGDEKKAESLYQEISSLEHEADKVKHSIRENLPSSQPVDRADILSFLTQEDDVANSAEMVAQMLAMKMVRMPLSVSNILLKMDREVLLTVKEHVAATGRIVDILDNGSVTKEYEEIQALIDKVDGQKHSVDVIRLDAMKAIYDHEEELGMVGAYHLLEVVKELGWVAEHAESASNKLRLMTARR